MRKFLPILIIFSIFFIKANAARVYVDSTNLSGTQDGTSWATAYYSFQFAMDYSNPGDTIWVAKGTYTPILGMSFTLKENRKIYGGFLNTYTSFSQRDWETNKTILTGNQSNIIKNDSVEGITNATILDGFTLKNGYASSSTAGGAMSNKYASPTIVNCLFIANTTSPLTYGGGGAIGNYFSSPIITNCKFISNICNVLVMNPPNASGFGGGGAISNTSSSPIITNCTFSNNTTQTRGGAIYNTYASFPIISYSTFGQNHADYGGAIYNEKGSSINVDSCYFSKNRGTYYAGAIWNDSIPSVNITRCIFEKNRGGSGGGAILIRNSGIVLIENIYCYADSANQGGAINIANCATVSILNSDFEANKAIVPVVKQGQFIIQHPHYLSEIVHLQITKL